MPLPHIDTTSWGSEPNFLNLELQGLTVNNVGIGTPVMHLSEFGRPDYNRGGILGYYNLGITFITNTRIVAYVYLYATDGRHGFEGRDTASTGGPYSAFRHTLTIDNEDAGFSLFDDNGRTVLNILRFRPEELPRASLRNAVVTANSMGHVLSTAADFHFDESGSVTYAVVSS